MTAAPSERPPAPGAAVDLAAALLPAGLFLAVGFWILVNGHLHEDAYILFIYAEMLADSGRIAFFAGGPPAEGATDFLWMVTIAALLRLGLGAASAVVCLNAAGIALMAFVLFRQLPAGPLRPAIMAAIVLLLPVWHVAAAGYAGFSAALYAALVMVIFALSYRGTPRHLLWLPPLGLLLGLFRPDGVIVGVAAALVGLHYCGPERRRAYLAVSVAVAVAGVAYFVWRWSYFGNMLPLPLYVKSEDPRLLPGAGPHLTWLLAAMPLALAALFHVLAFSKDRVRLVLSALPVALLMVALLFAAQTQNVAHRFQAPASAILLFLAVRALGEASLCRPGPRLRNAVVAVTALAALAFVAEQARATWATLRYLTNDDYLNFFPYLARDRLFDAETVMAVTEAGRAPYWVAGRKYDLVGLNTAYTAINGADPVFLERIDPDIILLHVVDTLSLDCRAERYCLLGRDAFMAAVAAAALERHDRARDRFRRALLATYEFLAVQGDGYDLVLVRYGAERLHLYAVKRAGRIRFADLLEVLDLSFSPEGRRSYWQMKADR